MQRVERNIRLQPRQNIRNISPDIDTADTKSLPLKRRGARGTGCKTDTAFGG
jgi:hypothetical protein